MFYLYELEVKLVGREEFDWEKYSGLNPNMQSLDQMMIVLKGNKNVIDVRLMEYELPEGREVRPATIIK